MRTWELAFNENASFNKLERLINILRDWNYEVDTTSNREGDNDYIYEVYDEHSDCIWADGDGVVSLRHALASSCVIHLDQVFGKGKPQVIVGDAVKVPFPRSSHVGS
jgi:hypothetical protein